LASYQLRNPPVICENVEGEVIAINLDNGVYHSLRGDAAGVWAAILDGASLEIIASACTSAGSDAKRSLDAFVARLVELELITEIADQPTSESGAIASWAPDGLAIESYKDMTDLLGLDPVHEADLATGWPIAAEQ